MFDNDVRFVLETDFQLMKTPRTLLHVWRCMRRNPCYPVTHKVDVVVQSRLSYNDLNRRRIPGNHARQCKTKIIVLNI